LNDKEATYRNLQQYLEEYFKDTDTITDVMLKQAKQKWRSIYLSRYHKRYREKHVQISFRLSRQEYQRYKQLAKQHKMTVTSYIKNLVLQHQKTSVFSINTIPLLEVIDLLEEAIYEDHPIDINQVLSLLYQCQTVDNDR